MEAAEPWPEQETHEGCQIFGYMDVSRAPGTLHISPHSGRHSFDFSNVNTSHYIDHLSFGLELSTRDRGLLPASVRGSLTALDGHSFVSKAAHETQVRAAALERSHTSATGLERSNLRLAPRGSNDQALDLPHLVLTRVCPAVVRSTTSTSCRRRSTWRPRWRSACSTHSSLPRRRTRVRATRCRRSSSRTMSRRSRRPIT